jgi:hypothetical protein
LGGFQEVIFSVGDSEEERNEEGPTRLQKSYQRTHNHTVLVAAEVVEEYKRSRHFLSSERKFAFHLQSHSQTLSSCLLGFFCVYAQHVFQWPSGYDWGWSKWQLFHCYRSLLSPHLTSYLEESYWSYRWHGLAIQQPRQKTLVMALA